MKLDGHMLLRDHVPLHEHMSLREHMPLHGQMSLPSQSVLKECLIDLGNAVLLALVPVTLCVLIFAEDLLVG